MHKFRFHRYLLLLQSVHFTSERFTDWWTVKTPCTVARDDHPPNSLRSTIAAALVCRPTSGYSIVRVGNSLNEQQILNYVLWGKCTVYAAAGNLPKTLIPFRKHGWDIYWNTNVPVRHEGIVVWCTEHTCTLWFKKEKENNEACSCSAQSDIDKWLKKRQKNQEEFCGNVHHVNEVIKRAEAEGDVVH